VTARRFHAVLGVVLLATFLLTGQYMDRIHAHLDGMADGPRLLYRSRHIYVLMSALLNITLAAYLVPSKSRLPARLQLAGSTVVAAASLAMVVAFFYDAPHANFERLNLWWSRGAIYGLVAGVLLHAAAGATQPTTDTALEQPDAGGADLVRSARRG
jgi:hypothetical protein